MLISEKKIRQIIREELLREKAFDPYNIPAGVKFRLTFSDPEILLIAHKNDFEIGRIEARMRDVDVHGPCYGAFVIGYSRSQIKGLGPLMYDIVMEAATSLGGGLISGRFVVSSSARNVWTTYQEDRPDVDREQLDSLEDEITRGVEFDNCDATLAKSASGDEWADYPLSGAYRKPGMKTINSLVNLKKLEVKGIKI